jgi:hypothetical protein
MNKELRKRAQLFQNITNGLVACHRGEMTEQEFMEKNEEDLKDCEDSISQIRDAMRAKRGQRAAMTDILDSIKSLEAAKDVIRRLIVEIYSHWRIYMVFDEEESMRQQRETEESVQQALSVAKVDALKEVEELQVKYEQDVRCAFQMVSSFNDTVKSDEASQPLESSEQRVPASTLTALEKRERMLAAQLAERDAQMAAMRAELDGFQASAKSMEMKEESFRLMSVRFDLMFPFVRAVSNSCCCYNLSDAKRSGRNSDSTKKIKQASSKILTRSCCKSVPTSWKASKLLGRSYRLELTSHITLSSGWNPCSMWPIAWTSKHLLQ